VFPLEISLLTVCGILIGILIFAFKVSLGCGLASLSRRETLFIALCYLVLSGLMGAIIGLIPDEALAWILNAGMAMHAVVALLLVSLGVITAREWNHCGHDVSRRTFWALSFPCPACLAATFLCCSFLAAILETPSWKIGIVVGMILFFGIIGMSEVFRRSHPKPSVMGNAMIFVGLFYILSMLVVPAYLGSKISSTPTEIPAVNAVYIYGFLLGMILLGFIGKKMGVAI
jgi:predicted transporter